MARADSLMAKALPHLQEPIPRNDASQDTDRSTREREHLRNPNLLLREARSEHFRVIEVAVTGKIRRRQERSIAVPSRAEREQRRHHGGEEVGRDRSSEGHESRRQETSVKRTCEVGRWALDSRSEFDAIRFGWRWERAGREVGSPSEFNHGTST